MSKKPFKDADVLWLWKPTEEQINTDAHYDEYAIVRDKARRSGLTIWHRIGTVWMQDTIITSVMGAELIRQLDASQKRVGELEKESANHKWQINNLRCELRVAGERFDVKAAKLDEAEKLIYTTVRFTEWGSEGGVRANTLIPDQES